MQIECKLPEVNRLGKYNERETCIIFLNEKKSNANNFINNITFLF